MSTDGIETVRERIAKNPRPAYTWAAAGIILLVLELGRVADGILQLFGIISYLLRVIFAVPVWVGGNFADITFGPITPELAVILGLVVTSVIGFGILYLFSIPLRKRLRYSLASKITSNERYAKRGDQGIIAATMGMIVALYGFTPFSTVLNSVYSVLVSPVKWMSSIPTITSRDVIPNQGHRTVDGGWEGTFLSGVDFIPALSPAQAWSLRVVVVHVIAFATLYWLWKGYEIYREYYRRADWTPTDDWIKRFKENYWGMFGFVIISLFLIMALWAPALTPAPFEHNIEQPYQHEIQYLDGETVKTTTHGSANLDSQSTDLQTIGPLSYDDYDRWAPFGTDDAGKDIFTFVAFGARTSLIIGLVAIGAGAAIAAALSMLTAYYKGISDTLTVITTDTIISIPAFLLVLLLSIVLDASDNTLAKMLADPLNGGLLLAIAFAFVYWPGMWRSIRGPALQVAEREWVEAAKSYGQRPSVTMRKHMAPYVLSYLMIYASLLLGGIIIATAALSFLGLGVEAPTPEWGRLIDNGQSYIATSSWHISTIPGIMIVLVVTGFNALGDGIRDAIDPESNVGEDGGGMAGGGGA